MIPENQLATGDSIQKHPGLGGRALWGGKSHNRTGVLGVEPPKYIKILNFLSPECIMKVKYKINLILKTEHSTKKLENSEIYFRTLCIFFVFIAKLIKLGNCFFINFRTLCVIFDQKIKTALFRDWWWWSAYP